MISTKEIPLKAVASISNEVLAESTPGDFDFLYVDIGNVDSNGNIVGVDRLVFRDAPSRARRRVRRGDVIVSTVRTYLKAIAAIEEDTDDLVVSTGFAVLRPRRIESRFLAYAVRSEPFVAAIVSNSDGVSYPAIPPARLARLKLPVPTPEEQRAIARFLDEETAKIDAVIEKKVQLVTLLQQERTATITGAVTKGLNRDAQFRDSGIDWLGQVPSHWEVRRLRHLGQVTIGLTYDPADLVTEANEGTLVLRASNVQRGRIVFEDNVFVRTQIPDSLRTRTGDILICSRSGSRALIGKSAKIDASSAGLTFGAFMTVFRSIHNQFLFHVLNSTVFEYQSSTFLTSTINQLTVNSLKNFAVPFPPAEERTSIVALLDRELTRLESLITKVYETIDQTQEYRSALITAAVTGQIDVTGATS